MKTCPLIALIALASLAACERRAQPEREGAAEGVPAPERVGAPEPEVAVEPPADAGLTPAARTEKRVEAEFKPAAGYDLQGKVQFTQGSQGGVLVAVQVEKAPPGKHGIHIHQTADCSNLAGESMGGHFAPDARSHGLPGAQERHLGDLGNIDIGADGKGQLQMTLDKATLTAGDKYSLLGRSVVIREREDKGTGTSGGAGKPIACAALKTE